MHSTERGTPVHIIGGGLAGSEATYQLARRGHRVILHEMRPVQRTPAHETGDLAELVCSNTLGSLLPHTAPGVFKRELRVLGSLIVSAAEASWVPAGGALGVDRHKFSAAIEQTLRGFPNVEILREEVRALPTDGPVLVATGPLCAPSLAAQIRARCGGEDLYFYDAIAPIVDLDSVSEGVGFWADRYGEADGGDYLNLPFDKAGYEAFIDLLLSAECVQPHGFEEERLFSGCQPVERIAASGRESLRFGPMKPVGLRDPQTGRRPWAAVQLRRETRDGTAMNLVGFQTKLRHPEQVRVFRTIPGLAEAEFLRLGSIHRNTYLNTPRRLDESLALKDDPRLRFAGQMVGCEGYTESSALGLWAALRLDADLRGVPLPPPPRESMLGALLGYLRDADPANFQPMNVNFGLLPAVPGRARGVDKKQHRQGIGAACLAAFRQWADQHAVAVVGSPVPGGESARAFGDRPESVAAAP